MNRRLTSTTLAAVAASLPILLSGQTARAQQIQFDLTPDTPLVAPGGAVSFVATLFNDGAAEVFLNGDSFELFGVGLSLDDTKFFLNTPLSLQAGEGWSGEVFDVSVTAQAQPGTYPGVFRVLGGPDPSGVSVLAERQFSVVVPAASAAPEPMTLNLLASATSAVWLLRRRSRRASALRRDP